MTEPELTPETPETETPATETPTPAVSIGLPVYNGERYLAEAIDAILAQTYRDFELIISDNASTDGTQAICERYAAADPRVRYDRLETNLGAAPNYNRLLDLARGRYFKWGAHDDNIRPTFLAQCVAVLDARPDVVCAYPATFVIDGEGAVMSEYRDRLDLPQETPHERLVAYLRQNFMRGTGMCNPVFGLIRTEELRKTRLIQDFPASDRSLLGHLTLLGKFVELPEPLFERRVHDNISTIANRSIRARRAWFNPKAKSGLVRLLGPLINNKFGHRLTQFSDFYRAIRELIGDPAERRRCRNSLTRLIVSDPKWVYLDLKTTLGLGTTKKRMLSALSSSRAA